MSGRDPDRPAGKDGADETPTTSEAVDGAEETATVPGTGTGTGADAELDVEPEGDGTGTDSSTADAVHDDDPDGHSDAEDDDGADDIAEEREPGNPEPASADRGTTTDAPVEEPVEEPEGPQPVEPSSAVSPGDGADIHSADVSAEPVVHPSHRAAEPQDQHQDQDQDQGAWHRLGAALRPRRSRSQVLAGLLCAALGFALVVQVQQSSSDQLSSARQDDLVRLLDEVTDRAEQLATEVSGLESTRAELESGSDKARSALELAHERAESEGILSGRLPALGPGVRIVVTDPGGVLEAAQLFNVLEELRNAGAEVVQVDDVRLVTSTWFRDDGTGIEVDGQKLDPPYVWRVIGDPQTLDRALEIPGGALATVRNAGGEATTTQQDEVEITEVREPSEPEYAEPQERQQ